jgi:hypothetical protein
MNAHAPCPFDPTETVTSVWPLPKRIVRAVLSAVCSFPDTGLFGLTPLKKHIIICGYPRSGSTMLQLMLQHAYPRARRFGQERRGHHAALLTFRNHDLLISKDPSDIRRLHRLINHYAKRSAELKPILLIRDPRDVLTSHHAHFPDRPYFFDIAKFDAYDRCLKAHENSPEVLVMKYEDLVLDVATSQQLIEEFVGEPGQGSLDQFHANVPSGFKRELTLNGVRPVDTKSLGRWRDPKHADRIRQILADIPTFGQRLIELGYERDENWIFDYRRRAVA